MNKRATVKKNKTHKHHRLLLIIGIVLLSIAVFLLCWLLLSQVEQLQARYAQIMDLLTRWETAIASLENRWLLIFVIFLLFALKSFIPMIPLSALFITSGMVFDVRAATAINIVGVAILVSIRFIWGDKFGGGTPSKLISRFAIVREFTRLDADGNTWLLFVARLVPITPVNVVSQLYGSSKIPYDKYLFISLLGLAPRILSYSVLGSNVFDPFSVGFLVPIIVLFAVSGLSLMILDAALLLINDTKKSSTTNRKEAE